MKPFRILLFGLAVFLILAILSVVLPDRLVISPQISIKIPSLKKLFVYHKPAYKNISHILTLTEVVKDSVPQFHDSAQHASPKRADRHFSSDTLGANADSLRSLIRPLEFPEGRDTILNPFFESLQNLSADKKLIRIMHYGDSQIEGDRITSYIRNQFQLQFGGMGVGLFPIVGTNPSGNSYVYDLSDNWIRVAPGLEQTSLSKRYGALISYSRIDGKAGIFERSNEYDAKIGLKHANIPFSQAQRFQQCRLFYGFNKKPMMVQALRNKELFDAEIVPVSNRLKQLRWQFPTPVQSLEITFKGTESPDVYGLALDALEGVAVDNIPLRGSSGLEFTKTDLAFLKEFYQMLNVKLLILQFGVNIVPHITSDYSYYEHSFYKQLDALKRLCPYLSIIVIGVSDVSRNGENGFESYPNIEKIRDAQKRAAFATGCAFWDLYEVMGGHNSMPSWVYASPPLAQKDFVHLSPLGAKIVGEMFYRSFMQQYHHFQESKNQNVP